MKWMVHTSSVRVSTARGDRVFSSVEQAPPDLRRRIQETLAGPNCQTILIANQEAYDRVSRGEQDLPKELQRFKPALRSVAPRKQRRGGGESAEWRPLLYGGVAAIFMLWALWLWAIRTGMS